MNNYPDVSITAARKDTEFMVKLLYDSSISSAIYGMTVYDMLSDSRFIAWIGNEAFLRRFHFIRKMGNQAVHCGGFTQDEAMKTLEQLHALAGDLCLKLGLIRSYQPFDPNLTEDAEDEPKLDQALIARFAGCLHNVFAPSQQREKETIVNGFLSTKDMAELKKLDPSVKMENTAANSRVAFQILAEYLTNALGENNVLADYHDLCLHVVTEQRRIETSRQVGAKLHIPTELRANLARSSFHFPRRLPCNQKSACFTIYLAAPYSRSGRAVTSINLL